MVIFNSYWHVVILLFTSSPPPWTTVVLAMSFTQPVLSQFQLCTLRTSHGDCWESHQTTIWLSTEILPGELRSAYTSLTPLVVPPERSKTSKNINESLEKLIRWEGDFPLMDQTQTVFPNILVGIAHAKQKNISQPSSTSSIIISLIYP